MCCHRYSFPPCTGTKDTSWCEDIHFATVFSQMRISCNFPVGSSEGEAATEVKKECVYVLMWMHE